MRRRGRTFIDRESHLNLFVLRPQPSPILSRHPFICMLAKALSTTVRSSFSSAIIPCNPLVYDKYIPSVSSRNQKAKQNEGLCHYQHLLCPRCRPRQNHITHGACPRRCLQDRMWYPDRQQRAIRLVFSFFTFSSLDYTGIPPQVYNRRRSLISMRQTRTATSSSWSR